MIRSDLHIVIRPRLEYRMPHLCILTRDVVLGDKTQKHLQQSCSEYSNVEYTALPAGIFDIDLTSAFSLELHNHLMHMCREVDAYLNDMFQSWQQYVEHTCKSIFNYYRLYRGEYDSLCRQHHDTHSADFRSKLQGLNSNLHATLHDIRSKEYPVHTRPKSLIAASRRLQELFCTAEKQLHAKRTLAIKTAFDNRLFAIQTNIGRRLTHYLLAYVEKSNRKT